MSIDHLPVCLDGARLAVQQLFKSARQVLEHMPAISDLILSLRIIRLMEFWRMTGSGNGEKIDAGDVVRIIRDYNGICVFSYAYNKSL